MGSIKPEKMGSDKTEFPDNGIEFFWSEYIVQKLKADYFFFNPYNSWERGLNEYQNKLIRQNIPKKINF